jgi:pyruvate/2-oxoglutarate dehydrogenase complex dihydrolipoamide dehydrogenase (E3) component
VSAAITDILASGKIDIRTGAKALSVKKQAGEVTVEIGTSRGNATITGSHILAAIGRRPNTDDLGLDKAGIATDARGFIKVDDQLRTNVEGVYALGDCNGQGAFTHTSYNDNEIVAANILDNDPRRISDRIPAYALFIDPPLGRCGMTEDEVRKSGRPAMIATWSMERVGRAFERGETQGFMKVLVDRETKQILGASLLGIGGDEVVHAILDLMYAKAPYTILQRAVHIHPTVAEYLPTMLEKLEPLT